MPERHPWSKARSLCWAVEGEGGRRPEAERSAGDTGQVPERRGQRPRRDEHRGGGPRHRGGRPRRLLRRPDVPHKAPAEDRADREEERRPRRNACPGGAGGKQLPQERRKGERRHKQSPQEQSAPHEPVFVPNGIFTFLSFVAFYLIWYFFGTI